MAVDPARISSYAPASAPTSDPRPDQPAIAKIPLDVWSLILLPFTGYTPARLRLVCKTWKRIIDEKLLNIPVLQKTLVPSNLRQLPLLGFPAGYFSTVPTLINTPKEILAFENNKKLTIYSKKPVTPESKQTTLEQIAQLSGDNCYLNYLSHSPEYLLLQAGENVQVVDRATNQMSTLSPKAANDLLRFESEAQKATITRSRGVTAAYLTPSNQIVTITERAVVGLWDPKTLQCLKAFRVFSSPTAQEELDSAYPEVTSTHLIGSILVVNGHEGKPCHPEKNGGLSFFRCGCLYAVDLNTFTAVRLHQAGDIRSISSDRYLFVEDSKSKAHGYRLEQGLLTKVWSQEQKDNLYSPYVGANSYCLVYKSYNQFTIVSADTGKKLALIDFPNARFCKGFVTKQLALFYHETNDAKVLDIHVTPLGKKIASYKLSELCQDFAIGKECEINSIAFENNQLTIAYQTRVGQEKVVRALMVSMPEDAILVSPPQITSSKPQPVSTPAPVQPPAPAASSEAPAPKQPAEPLQPPQEGPSSQETQGFWNRLGNAILAILNYIYAWIRGIF